MGGVGGILRDWNGVVKGYFSIPLGDIYAHEAEIKAILWALKFCKEFGFMHIGIESDSSLVVGWVAKRSYRPWKLLNDLNLIYFLKDTVICTSGQHIYREANDQADELAKSACDRTDPVWVVV